MMSRWSIREQWNGRWRICRGEEPVQTFDTLLGAYRELKDRIEKEEAQEKWGRQLCLEGSTGSSLNAG